MLQELEVALVIWREPMGRAKDGFGKQGTYRFALVSFTTLLHKALYSLCCWKNDQYQEVVLGIVLKKRKQK